MNKKIIALSSLSVFVLGSGLCIGVNKLNSKTVGTAAVELVETATPSANKAVAANVNIQKISEKFADLSLHTNEIKTYSSDEIDNIIIDGIEKWRNGETNKVDVSKYISSFSSGVDISSLENKSFVYHMILNSVDNFTSAKGTVIDGTISEVAPTTIEFVTDIEKQSAYCSASENEEVFREGYTSDGMTYAVNSLENTYKSASTGNSVDYVIDDNERILLNENNEPTYLNRTDITNLAYGSSTCLYAQSLAFGYLSNFDLWDIIGTETLLERECAVIKGSATEEYGGKFNVDTFIMYVDINTGALLKFEGYSADGELASYTEVKSIDFNGEYEIPEFNSDGLIKE